MYSKKIKIAGLENTLLLKLKVSLDNILITVEEKTSNAYEWHGIFQKTFIVTEETYDFKKIISETLEEYGRKKSIERMIKKDIEDMNIKEIELPRE